MPETIRCEERAQVVYLTLARPEVRNAFDDRLVAELSAILAAKRKDSSLRALVLQGEGKAFCAGADLNHMRATKAFGYERNLQDALALADCFELLGTFPAPTICRIHGAAIGGGVGLVAACDFAFAAEGTMFSLSEVKIGLVPACISPYVIARLGAVAGRQYFMSGERFPAEQALELGLVDKVLPEAELNAAVEHVLDLLASSAPMAVRIAKSLVEEVTSGASFPVIKRRTAEIIASLRAGDEAQEGMSAFLEKRRPRWNP